ncbi:homoserine O-succinyltransferase [Alphaproteobacteria bacterium LSUCC0684]
MPIKIQHDLPARSVLEDENVDLIISDAALKQDIRPLRILLLNLMPKKKETEIQFARLLGNSPLQIELTLMATASYTPKNTEPGYLRRYYRSLDDIRDEYFDAILVTGAPVETLPFTEVNYWPELKEIFDWSQQHCFRRLGICWGAQALLYHFYGLEKHQLESKVFGIYDHLVTENTSRLMKGFTDLFPMPVSRYTTNLRDEILAIPELDLLAESRDSGPGMVRDSKSGDIFIFNHLEYDAETLGAEYSRDSETGLGTALPVNYFPGDDPSRPPTNFWRPFAYLFMTNWIHDLYQATPFDLEKLAER